jgi:phenol hydroxylase P1 protein
MQVIRLKSSDREAFRDPKTFWYTTYVNNRKKLVVENEWLEIKG